MNKIYLIAPLVAVAIFGGVYANYARAYHARQQQAEELVRLVKKEKLAQQVAAQAAAQREASAALARRQAERAEKERLEAAHHHARWDAEQRRLAAYEQEKRLRARLERLRTDVAGTTEAIRRAEADIEELTREQAFLADYVKEAETNRASFSQLLERLEIVERSRLATTTQPAQPARP